MSCAERITTIQTFREIGRLLRISDLAVPSSTCQMAPASIPIAPSLSASTLEELATSGAIDQIANSPGSIRRYIQGRAVQGKDASTLTWKSIFFVIYQTGRYGPQNGYRLCLVHEGFDIESDLTEAEKKIEQSTQEFIVIGPKPPRIEDPMENLLDDLSDVEQGT